MKKLLLIILLVTITGAIKAQKQGDKIETIVFHLYTDSLKKGTHNYINVDGKLTNGRWMPLTENEVIFSSSACKFSGNELIVPANFAEEKITVKASLKSDPKVSIEKTIWIKTKPDPDKLPTKEDVMKRKN